MNPEELTSSPPKNENVILDVLRTLVKQIGELGLDDDKDAFSNPIQLPEAYAALVVAKECVRLNDDPTAQPIHPSLASLRVENAAEVVTELEARLLHQTIETNRWKNVIVTRQKEYEDMRLELAKCTQELNAAHLQQLQDKAENDRLRETIKAMTEQANRRIEPVGVDREVETTPHYDRVKEFMVKAGQNCPPSPIIPSPEVRVLRAKLTWEECAEELDGLGVTMRFNPGDASIIKPSFKADREPDLVKILDGALDTIVIATGTLIACGLTDVVPQRLVDESNLAKFKVPECCGVPMRLERVSHPSPYGPTDDYLWACQRHGSFDARHTKPLHAGGHRREDGKWVKPRDWVAPDLGSEIERQRGMSKA